MSVRTKLTMMAALAVFAGALVFLPFLFEIGIPIAAAVFAVMTLLLVLLSRNLIKTAVDPIDRMNKTVVALTDGKIDINLRSDAAKVSGEIGILENGLAKLAINHHNFNGDLDAAVKKAQSGEMNANMDGRNYPGGLRETASQINLIANGYEKVNNGLVNAIDGFTRGDFKPNVMGMNEKTVESLERLGRQLQTLKDDANLLGQAAKEGNLAARTTGSYTGEWQRIASDMNAILESLTRPAADIVSALERLESANFSSSVQGSLPGDFEKIKSTLERINELYSGHLSELSSVLNDISYGRNPNMTRSYRGSFQQLQSAVNSVSRGYERLAEDLRRAAQPSVPRTAITPRAAAQTFNTAPRPAAAPPPAKPSFTPPARPAHTPSSPAPARTQSVTPPPLPVNSGRVVIPSGAHEYNRKDFGKYK